MGDRVAVMRKGELQQVDEPQTLYDRPRQPLRRRLHRLAGDEHARGDGRARERRRRGRRSATRRSRSTTRSSQRSPALQRVRGPHGDPRHPAEHLEDASLARDTPADRRLRGTRRAARGARLGADGALHRRGRPLARRPRRRRSSRATWATDARAASQTAGRALRRPLRRPRARRRGRAGRGRRSTRAPCTSSTRRRVSGSTTRSGERSSIVSKSLGLGGPPSCRGGHRRSPPCSAAVERRVAARQDARAPSPGSITLRRRLDRAPRRSAFGDVIKAFNKKYPDVKVNYKPVGDNLPTVLSTAVAGGNPPDMADIAQPGLVKQFVDKGALKPIGYARKHAARELRAVVDRARHLQQEDLRARLQGEQQVDGLVQRPRLQERRASRPRRPGRSSRRRPTR